MSATEENTGVAVDIDDDVGLITAQIKALKALGARDDQEPITEGERYDFSIRWGTVLAGRLRRLVHYSSLGRLARADERRFRDLREELATLSDLVDRFRLAQPVLTPGPAATAKRFRGRRYRRRRRPENRSLAG